MHPLPQEQAAPCASGRRPAGSWAGSAGQASEQAADTYRQPQGHLGLPSATVAAAAARAARPADPLRQSVNSRPLSSFAGGQPAPSLQTQAPSAGRSVRWQVCEGSPAQWGASSGGAAAAAHVAAAAVLPGQVKQQCLVQQEAGAKPTAGHVLVECNGTMRRLLPCCCGQQIINLQFAHLLLISISPCCADEEVDFSKLPMTQAGFIPAADLLEQLRASTAGLLHAEPAPQPAQPQQQCQPLQPQLGVQPAQQHSSPAGWQPQPPAQPQVQRYAWRGSPEQPTPSRMQVDSRVLSPTPGAHSLAMARQGAAAAAPTSTADLLQQLRLSSGVQQQAPPSQQQPPPQEAKRPAIPTDVLVQQLRASAIMASVQGEQVQQPQQPQQQQQQQAQQQPSRRLATEELLAALRAAPAAGAAGQRQPEPEAQQAEPAGGSAAPDLLLQLQQVAGLSMPAGQSPTQQAQQRQAAPATANLLQQLQAAPMPAASKPQRAEWAAPATADLLQQLQAVCMPTAASVEQQRQRHPALSTAELVEQLRASADFRSVGSRLPAQQAQHGVESGTAGQQSGTAAAEVQAGDISSLLQQLQQLPSAAVLQPHQPVQPAAADVPVVQAEVAAAAASRLADQMRSLLQEAQPAAGLGTPLAAAPAARGQPEASSSRSTEELLALLRRQQEQRHGADEPPAASVATDGGAGELLAKLRELAPPAAVVPPHPQVPVAAGCQQQQPQQAQRAASGPASEDEEMPPAKYQRQYEPESHAAAAFGTLPAERQASAAPPATPAADAGSVEGDGGSLAPTAMVSGAQADGASWPSGSVPDSSAGSPPLVRPQAGTPPAPAPADAVSPAGSGSGKPDAASSQVCSAVVAGWVWWAGRNMQHLARTMR